MAEECINLPGLIYINCKDEVLGMIVHWKEMQDEGQLAECNSKYTDHWQSQVFLD